ncbi:pericentrin isoform X13 [Monodelphis domestica]|uniref:pericentrin isoform X13 n=1 Tax=Monodelphis domestica TaxID=13616 RepID=UPI0024E23D89|nr:pericentrin isoform X13 [Monodelphis domestica]
MWIPPLPPYRCETGPPRRPGASFKLAQFRQRKTKGDSPGSKKKASKRKSSTVHEAVQEKEEERAVEPPEGELPSDVAQSVAGPEPADGVSGAPEAKAERGLSSLGTPKSSIPELIVQGPGLEDNTPSLATEPRAQEATIKMLEEKLVDKQEDIDLLSQEVGELQAQLAQCSEAAQLQQELEMAVQERDRIIVQLTSNLQLVRQNHEDDQQEVLLLASQIQGLQLQLQENSELLKSKTPAKGCLSQSQLQAAASLQGPREPNPPSQGWDLEKLPASSQKNFKEKEAAFAQMEEHGKSASQQPSQVVSEKEGMISSLQDQLGLAGNAGASAQHALSVKSSKVIELKREKQDCMEESQVPPPREACGPLLQNLGDELGETCELGVAEARKAYGDTDGKSWGASPVPGLRGSEQQSLGGLGIDFSSQFLELAACAMPESHRATFQEERNGAEHLENDDHKKRKLPSAEKIVEEALASKGDDEIQNLLNFHVRESNEKMLQETENSGELRLKHGMTLGQANWEERTLLGQKAELQGMPRKLCLRPRESDRHEVGCRDGLQTCCLNSEEENPSLELGEHEDDQLEVGSLQDEVSSEESRMEETRDLMEKYLVSTERDQSRVSEAPDHFDLETALQRRSERESLDFLSDELIIGLDGNIDSNVLFEGNSVQVESYAAPWTDRQEPSGFSQGDLSEILELMDKDKAYLMQRCVKLSHLLREKELALKTFSQEVEEEVAEERWWEGKHRLLNVLSQEGGGSCDEIVPRLKGEEHIKLGTTAGGITDLAGWASVTHQPHCHVMDEVSQKEEGGRSGKIASASVGLEALCSQEENRPPGQLRVHKPRSHMPAGCSSQKITLEESLLQEVETLKAEMAIKENLFTQVVEEKNTLEEKFTKDRENLEENILELIEKIKCLEKGLGHEKVGFAGKSTSVLSEDQKLDAKRKVQESDFLSTENSPIQQTISLKNAQVEPEWLLQEEAQKATCALEDVRSELSSYHEKQMSQMKHQHEQERTELRREHQKEVEATRKEMKEKLEEQQQRWEQERREQISAIKKIHEREHDREIAELVSKHKEEMTQLRDELHSKHQQMMEGLQQQMQASHRAEMQQAQLQAQTLHTLELEALRLSLSNMHTAQLELTQANLRKEKETALVELREMLNDKRAQELALLQSRLQFELEHVREQHRKEKEEMALKHQQERADLGKKLELQVETQARTLETLRGDWASERDSSLRRLQEELATKHQAEMESLRGALRAQLAEQQAELDKMGHDKSQAEATLRSLQAQHQLALQDLRQELQLQHDQYLEDLNLKCREKQTELDTLQASYEELKVQSHREIQQLWAQLDSTRASRHELNELKEQLVARTSHVEELERLKHGFEQRQRQWRNEHETELEQLRVYFEQKLRDAEESYREDLHLLQQRLREVREDSFLDSEDVSLSVGFVEEEAEMERKAHLEQLILQLEQHKDGIAHLRLQLEGKHREESATLEASLRARHEEEVRKVKADLSEKHAAHVEDLKQQHRLQLDQLRGGLSEEHRKDITKLHLQCAQLAARQVEAEVAERVSVLEDDHLARVAQLQSEEQLISQLREQVDLARRENMELQEKVQQEVRLREEAEKMRCRLVKDHQTEIERMKEEIRQMIQKDQGREDAWRAQSEESLAALALELNGKAEQERQALRQALEAHVTELEQLRDRQAADIARLETSLGEARAQEEATGRLREECALELQANRARFLEEQREMMQKATEKQDVLLRELQDKHASELQIQSQQLEKRHGQQTEALTAELQSQHLEEMDALRTSLQAQHQAQLEARETELQAQHQAQLEARETELQAQHQAQLEARETELQAQHQAQLEARETELQVQHQAQLEARETELQAQHQAQLEAWEAELQAQHQAELETHVAELQARHLGQLEARAAEMQAQHRAQVEAQEAELQDRHRAQVAVLQAQHASETSGLEAKHLSNLDSLESCYLSEIQTIQEEHNRELEQLQARLEEQLREKDTQYEELLAQEKEKHQQELQQAQESLKIEMTTKHIEKLKALTAQLQDAHQEDLQAALHRQRALLEEDHHKALDILREEVVRMEEQHRSALGELKDIHTAELGKLQEELGSLRAQHKRDREEEARAAAAQSEEAKRQRELLFQQEMELLKGQSEVVLAQQMAQLKEDLETEKRAALREAEELLALEREKAQALCQREEALTLQLQEQSGLILQLKEKVLSLNSEVSESHEELKKLQERRHREHEEGTNLLSLLRSDMDHTQNERKTLQETNQWLLSLFGDTLKATIAMRSQISKRIGICLDEDSLSKESRPMGTPGQLAQGACQLPGDMSPEGPIPPLDFDQTMPECDETLLPECDETLLPGNDISCHVRESFFLSPEVTVECEQPIRRIYQSLGAAVDNLLEMTLDSNKQLEETRERHARFEKEFNRKNEETAQVARQHQELMDCLNQESAAKNQLAVELHKAEGLAEGYRAEKAALEEALAQKEESEHRLAVELENLKAQFQALTREQAKLKEEQNLLLRQKEMLIVEAEEKAAALRKEVEHLVREQAETRQQSEKDCASLRSHLRALELEVEEQLPQQQELVRQAAEIQDLRQQIVSLDKHLRNQRQFMDEQAIEREHERDEFQQEIQKLEEQLKQQPPKSQPWGEPWDSESFELNPEVESLQRQLREKIDELNELVIKKELAERQLLAQKDEIKNLEDANAEIRKKVSWLEEELEKQKKIGKELRQDKEALQEQQMNNLIQISTLQSKLDEAKHLQPVQGSPSEEDLREQLRAEQTALQLKAREVQNLEDELGELKKNLTSKSEEIVQLNLELALQNRQISGSIQELSAENADLKIQQKPVDVCQLQKGDLITQVRHIQEKLHHLIRSISCRDSHVQVLSHGAPLSPPQRLGSHVPGPAWGQPAAGQSPPPQGPVSTVLQHSWTLHDRTESPDPPGQGGPTPTLDKTPDAWLSSPSDADPSTPDFSCSEDCVAAQRAPPCTETPGSPPPGGSARGSPPSARSAEEASQDADPLDAVQHFRDTILDMDSSSLGSPELVRKDSTLDRLPSVHLTPLSQAADLQSPDSAWRSLGLQDSSGCLAFPALPGLEASPQPSLTEKARPRAGRATEATVSEKDVEDFILTPSNSQEHLESAAPGERGESDGHDNKRSAGLPDKLRQDPERSEAADTRLGARHPPGMVQRPLKPTKDKEMQSKQMKALLKMVCDESQQILVLSKCEAPASDLGSALPAPTPDCFQKERQGLLDAVQALKEHLTRVPARGEEKEPSDTGFDWGGEFLQAVQEVLEKERNMLKIELQSKLCSLDSGDERSLLEKLEDVVKEQGELQKRTLENLHLTDRSSLLSEIQGLRAQLRMTHLQNQEKLQQLYEALTNVEDHGSKQEYQFRRQVELLEYKVEQEKCIVSDLQKTLTEEQEKATENQRLLLAAQNTSQELKAELEECQQEKESAAQALREAQKEAAHLRSLLENQETDLKAALDALQSEKQRGKELQALVEEGQRHSLEQDELRAKAIEELQASLDKQRSQNGQLAVSLQHEQTEKANLKKELQIEYSRCEALLCQERGQVCELQRALEAERAHAAELAEALGHERLVTERLSKRAGEASSQKEAQLQQAFVRKLKEEKGRGAELQVLLDEARQQALAAQKQLELEVQAHREEMKKEKEVSVLLQASADALHKQKQELLRYLEEERAKQGRLQAELEQLQLGPKDEAGPEARRDKDRRREAGSADEDKSKRGKKDKERLGWQRELELQRQRDEHKIQQLQQTISELQNDKGFVPSRGWQECGVGVPLPPNTEKLKEHQEQLQSVRQQLLHAVALLTSFMNQTVNRTINDWASSNEKAVTSLLLTLEELKSELMMTLPQVSSHWMGAGGGARAGPALGVAMRLHSETCFPHCGTKCS